MGIFPAERGPLEVCTMKDNTGLIALMHGATFWLVMTSQKPISLTTRLAVNPNLLSLHQLVCSYAWCRDRELALKSSFSSCWVPLILSMVVVILLLPWLDCRCCRCTSNVHKETPLNHTRCSDPGTKGTCTACLLSFCLSTFCLRPGTCITRRARLVRQAQHAL